MKGDVEFNAVVSGDIAKRFFVSIDVSRVEGEKKNRRKKKEWNNKIDNSVTKREHSPGKKGGSERSVASIGIVTRAIVYPGESPFLR